MRNGYIFCTITYSEAHLLATAEGLPPASIATTDWSYFPQLKFRRLENAIYFLLRIPGNSCGLYRALEEMMDVAGVYRESYDYTGLKNHRRLLDAVAKIQRGTTDRVVVDFWLSPALIRERELEYFEWEEASYWRGYQMCLEDPGCAKHVRTTFPARAC